MHHFDEPTLLRKLKSLPARAQSAFAQACAIRIQRSSSDTLSAEAKDLCGQVLSQGLAFAVSGASDRDLIEELLADLEELTELDDDRVAACAYVARHLLLLSEQEAAWTARRAYEACDAYAQREADFDEYTVEVERSLLAHAFVQRELEQQANDLRALSDGSSSPAQVVKRAESHV